jgi:transcriptional regulator of nitric oxide reductase
MYADALLTMHRPPTRSPSVPLWLWLLALAGTTPLLAQQRIFTNPHPEAHFKAIMPAAAAFSTFGGTPLHWKAYATDPGADRPARPIGYIFWTTDLVPGEYGYHAPIHILVGLDTRGVITGAVVDYHSEPYGYFSVEPPEWAVQFKGKTVFDRFVVGSDIDAISRASITVGSGTRAVRDSVRAIARAFLDPAAVKRPAN